MKRKLDKKHQQSIIYITLHAREIFNRLRWADGIVCPYCGEKHVWKYKNGTYKCSHCNKHFSDTSNTIFHATKIPLSYWLVALYLITMSKGTSSEEVSRYLGITQKTAWYMMHKIRYAFKPDGTILEGDVAVDEVYLGGKWSSIIIPKKIDILKKYGLWYEGDKKRTWHKKNIQRAISEYKQPVYGMNDGKNIVLMAVPNRFNSRDLLDLTIQYTGNVQHLISDQSVLYKEIANTGIEVIQMNHSKREYKNGVYSSNRIEGTFSHLKRRYRCHYVRPNKKYIQLYLNEFCFRWNNSDTDTITRLTSAMNMCTSRGRLTRRDIDSYSWTDKYHQRKLKKRETIDDWLDRDWPDLINSIEVGGVIYTKADVERLKDIRDSQSYHIDKAELVF